MIGRSKEEQELNDLLSKTLVQREVMEPMNKIGWTHGNPPPPESGQPAPAEGAPRSTPTPTPAVTQGGQPAEGTSEGTSAGAKTDTPSPDTLIQLYESLRDPVTNLIAGKYKTVEDAIKGHVHLAQMAKRSFSERDQAVQKLSAIETLRATPTAQSVVSQPVSPTATRSLDEAQANLDAVLSKINENGGVLDETTARRLSEAQRGVAEAAADYRVQENLRLRKEQEAAEKNAWDAVDRYMAEKYPAASRFSDEIALFVESDPLIASAVNALLREGTPDSKIKATELAWTAFERSHGAQLAAQEQQTAQQKEADLAAREQVRQEAVAQARKDAGIVTGSAGGAGTHEMSRQGASREEIADLTSRMRAEGDAPGSPAAAAFRRAIIPLDPSIFGPM